MFPTRSSTCCNTAHLQAHALEEDAPDFDEENGADVTMISERLIAMLDNLGKGASGAAVQNLNLMIGAPETEGLRL